MLADLPKGVQVYPRPRGGTLPKALPQLLPGGLSPPTRGNPTGDSPPRPRRRSIPAHAGEPRALCPSPCRVRVYPRPRGGTAFWNLQPKPAKGLSPPTRGNPLEGVSHQTTARSIPAHAGGTPDRRPTPCARLGLSPPTRGNPHPLLLDAVNAGSIPAHAGEPLQAAGGRRARRVYPRPRGGTSEDVEFVRDVLGLSPPTRGNPNAATEVMRQWGSIPAHAGEPPPASFREAHATVYPRPRGGTGRIEVVPHRQGGLSPPTRGNLLNWLALGEHWRSIPAHAGEPILSPRGRGRIGVYPRPRGGTRMSERTVADVSGLSPPTRGNRARFCPRRT